MKFQSSEQLPGGKPQARSRKTSKLAPLVALTVLLTIPLYYPSIRDSSKKLTETATPAAFQSLDDPIKPDQTSHLEEKIIDKESTDEEISAGDDKEVAHRQKDPPVVEKYTKEAISDESTEPIDESTQLPAKSTQLPAKTTQLADEKHGGDESMAQGGSHHAAQHKKKHNKGRRKKPPRQTQTDNYHSKEQNTIISKTQEDVNNNNNNRITSQRDSNRMSRNSNRAMIRSRLLDNNRCDLFTGEWVPNPEGPYYTNDTCEKIQEHQNCLKFGRPDRDFLKWKWKPDDCELQLFDPREFLELVRGKSLAFVGDSVARNHMQSLICLLTRAAIPADLSDPVDQNQRYEFRDYDFNISLFWSPYLVRTTKTVPNDEKRPFNLYLDEFDEHWTSKIALFDYVIISAGHWFFRPTYFYLNRRLIGCLYCPETNVSHLTSYFSYRRAFRTAFRAVGAAEGFKGVVFLRTYATSHFEGAPWDKGGDCGRTRPFKRNETVMEDFGMEMYLIQLEELRIAQRAGRRTGVKFKLFDATNAMLLRPDGHPSKYGHWPVANQSMPNDCVHWCLPGPIDSWNDLLQELLKREIGDSSKSSF